MPKSYYISLRKLIIYFIFSFKNLLLLGQNQIPVVALLCNSHSGKMSKETILKNPYLTTISDKGKWTITDYTIFLNAKGKSYEFTAHDKMFSNEILDKISQINYGGMIYIYNIRARNEKGITAKLNPVILQISGDLPFNKNIPAIITLLNTFNDTISKAKLLTKLNLEINNNSLKWTMISCNVSCFINKSKNFYFTEIQGLGIRNWIEISHKYELKKDDRLFVHNIKAINIKGDTAYLNPIAITIKD